MFIKIENTLKNFFPGKKIDKNYSKIKKTYRLLIFEDDIKTLSVLINRLRRLEESFKNEVLAITVFAEYEQIKDYVNKSSTDFDLIILDRDCRACGSFYVLDFKKLNLDKIISVSSAPERNEEAKARGIKNIIFKDLNNLDKFAEKVVEEIQKMV